MATLPVVPVYEVVNNVTIVNSRLVTPVRRDFGDQFTMLCAGEGLAKYGSITQDGDAVWLNTNATYPNGDAIAPPLVVNRSKQPIQEELGAGSQVELAFKVVVTPKGTYYNLAAVKCLKFVKPFSLADVFDTVVNPKEPTEATIDDIPF
jgi:hypothetical protein